jgi:hypothetical protein
VNPEEIELIHVVADYGEKDPAFSEVFHRLKRHFPNAEIQSTPVPRFSTVATGFWIAQLGLHNPPVENSLIYSNTAPREVEDTADNNGREFVYAKLENGNQVFTVNSGHCLSFVRDSIEELREVDVRTNGSQFRSRDYFPAATAEVVENSEEKLDKEIETGKIPETPGSRVGFVDGYGNIKTTIRASEVNLEEGSELEVEINDITVTAFYEENTFEVPEGELSFAPGSSGGEDAFMEIFLRGGSAANRFDSPESGQKVEVKS